MLRNMAPGGARSGKRMTLNIGRGRVPLASRIAHSAAGADAALKEEEAKANAENERKKAAAEADRKRTEEARKHEEERLKRVAAQQAEAERAQARSVPTPAPAPPVQVSESAVSAEANIRPSGAEVLVHRKHRRCLPFFALRLSPYLYKQECASLIHSSQLPAMNLLCIFFFSRTSHRGGSLVGLSFGCTLCAHR